MVEVLGVSCEHSGHHLILSTEHAAIFTTKKPAIKRTLLKTLARVYDPLGYLTVFTIKAKLVFQNL